MFADLKPEDLGKLMLDMMRNKEKVLESFIEDIDRSEKQLTGLKTVIPSLTEETSHANAVQQLKTCMQIMARQQLTNKNLLMIMIVYISSRNFDGDLTQVANAMGCGKEALQEMWKQKMNGKG